MKILGKKVIDKDFREILTSEVLSVTGGLAAGTVLLYLVGRLDKIPGFLILLPGFLETHGNIFGSLAARLSVLLHTKKIQPSLRYHKLLYTNILASTFLLFIVTFVLGVFTSLLNQFFFHTAGMQLLYIALLAALIAVVIELPLTITTIFWLYKRHFEPDDIMGPYVTTTGDIISIIALFLATIMV